jgi:C4-dicarboxylate-specific signal transduction histidine kinase
MGLNISKRIAISLGGDLTFNDNSDNNGSEFELRIKAMTKPQVLK